MPTALWTQRREASLNWLALGLLLAAWNTAEDPGAQGASLQGPRTRPESLRGYAYVSVRAAARSADHGAVNKL
jgi:hypothetical protein